MDGGQPTLKSGRRISQISYLFKNKKIYFDLILGFDFLIGCSQDSIFNNLANAT